MDQQNPNYATMNQILQESGLHGEALQRALAALNAMPAGTPTPTAPAAPAPVTGAGHGRSSGQAPRPAAAAAPVGRGHAATTQSTSQSGAHSTVGSDVSLGAVSLDLSERSKQGWHMNPPPKLVANAPFMAPPHLVGMGEDRITRASSFPNLHGLNLGAAVLHHVLTNRLRGHRCLDNQVLSSQEFLERILGGHVNEVNYLNRYLTYVEPEDRAAVLVHVMWPVSIIFRCFQHSLFSR